MDERSKGERDMPFGTGGLYPAEDETKPYRNGEYTSTVLFSFFTNRSTGIAIVWTAVKSYTRQDNG